MGIEPTASGTTTQCCDQQQLPSLAWHHSSIVQEASYQSYARKSSSSQEIAEDRFRSTSSREAVLLVYRRQCKAHVLQWRSVYALSLRLTEQSVRTGSSRSSQPSPRTYNLPAKPHHEVVLTHLHHPDQAEADEQHTGKNDQFEDDDHVSSTFFSHSSNSFSH